MTETRDELVRRLIRNAIDMGAACQKGRSFFVVESGKPLRSVYEALAEEAIERLNLEHPQ